MKNSYGQQKKNLRIVKSITFRINGYEQNDWVSAL